MFAALAERWLKRRAERAGAAGLETVTLERLLCDATLGQFTASPAQRALMRAADGSPVDLPPEQMRYHFGCDEIPAVTPRILIPRTGVRAGKSLISSGGLLKSVLTCKFRRPPERDEVPGPDGLVGVRPGEFVRAVIVAPKLKLARSPLSHLVGTMRESPKLKGLLVKALAESCTVRRTDGREVTIELVAADSGGAGLRSTWLAGALFDEADFHDDEDAAVNLPEQIRAARTRLLAGAQMWIPSSPWTDAGPFHEMFTASFGKPLVNETLAFHSDSRSMNPTLSRADEEAERKRDPENAAREYDAIPIPAGTARFFPDDAIAKSINPDRPTTLPPVRDVLHYAGADWGLTKNSSVQAIARPEGGKARLTFVDELRPTAEESVSPAMTVPRFMRQAMTYGCKTVRGDHYLAPLRREERDKFVASLAFEHRASVPTFEAFDPNRDAQAALFTELRRRMQDGHVELPNDPRLLSQLKGATVAHLPGGATKVILPKQGHAHGDVLMAVALAIVACPDAEKPRHPKPPPPAIMNFETMGFGIG
jgi:hypothetical protein